jgi:hypothetical protein
MPDPKHLREVAARMLATAIQAKDTDWASQLSRRASDYLDEAAELERVAARRPRPDEPEKA